MNGRTARKIVWRNRSSYLFGQRSFVTALIPASVYPVPAIDFDPPGEILGFKGFYKRVDGDTIVVTNIGEVSGPNPHTTDRKDENGFAATAYFPKKYGEPMGADGKQHEWWDWWEITCARHEKSEVPEYVIGDRIGVLWEPDNAEAMVTSYKATRDWERKYISGILDSEEELDALSPLMQRILETGTWAKTTNFCGVEDGHVVIQWVVKYFYPDTKLGFAASLSRTVRHAKQHGIKIKVY